MADALLNSGKNSWIKRLKIWINDNSRPLYGLSATEHNSGVLLLFQPRNSNNSALYRAESEDGFNFTAHKHIGKLFCTHGQPEDISHISSARISKKDGKYIVFFQRQDDEKVYSATSTGLINWRECREQMHLRSSGMIAPDIIHKGKQLMYVGGDSIYLAVSNDGTKWIQTTDPTISIYDRTSYGIEYVMKHEAGIFVYYHKKKKVGKHSYFSVGLVVFDQDNPQKIRWRTHEPLWDSPFESYRQDIYPIGGVKLSNKLIGYWYIRNSGIFAVVYTLFDHDSRFTTRKISAQLNKVADNPMISPNPDNEWEAFNTFNPAAVYLQGKVHIVYRAQGYNYISTLGYATSSDGLHIDNRLDNPIFIPQQSFEYPDPTNMRTVSTRYISGGGYGGCEDPRITRIEERLYMTYVAFDGASPPRVALTSIAVSDFINRRWFWEKPVLISPPGIVNKNAVIFPEKINGKYVIFHRVYPNILIDFVESLEFDGKTQWLTGQHMIRPRPDRWDSNKIGAGAPPIKTKDGWLLIYQAVGYDDPHKYKVGAMLLDLDDPTKVLHRSGSPILEPDGKYENEGFKAGVAYPCGAVEIDNTLFVYYGGADSYVCVATAPLKQFVDELKHFEIPRLEPAVIRKVL